MSQDIRSFFFSSKQNLKENSSSAKKSRKIISAIVSSDEDEMCTSPLKNTQVVKIIKKEISGNKSRSKKRLVISSDEDELEVDECMKNKKAKIVNDKSPNQIEKLVEIVNDSEELLTKRPVKRINAIKIIKKDSKKSMKISNLTPKVDFMNEDDDFEATLNQLDTSQIEDEYLSSIRNEESPYLKFKEKDIANKQQNIDEVKVKYKCNFKSKNKDKLDSEEKKERLIGKNSLSKKNIVKKDHFDTKNTKLKEKEIKDLSDKTSTKSTDIDCNEIIQQKIEKKKHNAILYQNYLNRGGARNPGSKEIPQGADQCLSNLTFLITGVLDSLECEEAKEIIKQYGGRIVHSVSRKLNYIIVGDEPGPSKLAKAKSLGINKITEDGLLDLIRTRPSGIEIKKSTTNSIDKNKNKGKNLSSCLDNICYNVIESNKDYPSNENTKNIQNIKKNIEYFKNVLENPEKPIKNNNLSSKVESNTIISNIETFKIESKRKDIPIKSKINESVKTITKIKEVIPNLSTINKLTNKIDHDIDHITALVEKYRPKELKQIIGQSGEKSNAKKLQYWLTNWYKNHGKNSKITKSKFSSRDDTGTIYKAALLSGPPGIGKTTTAYVVCAQLHYDILEFNASDTRSKKLLQEEISGVLFNKTIKSFLINTSDKNKTLEKHVLLMDEVDGMGGNDDRGGMQELINFIKTTEIPIICICNDRNSQKIKSLVNYTFDLRFQKPRLEQIRAAMMSLCFKEGIKVTPEELTLIIQSTNQDIRQVINHIAILSAKSQILTENIENKKYKNLKLGPWDVVRKVFSSEEHKKMNIHDKSDLFFHDYNSAALFVQENYPIVTPIGPKHELHNKLANCSESLAIGDIIENTVRRNQNWNLLPVQACFSSIIPGSVMSGFINSQISFPSWLGRNSKTTKHDRLLQDITVHARITTGASKEAINLDYLKLLVNSIIRPMIIEGNEGINKSINVMNTYHLTREDLDSLIEITSWPFTRDPMQSVDSKTKTAFTKAYNKSASFNSVGTKKKKRFHDTQSEDYVKNDEEEVSDNDDDDKIENDKLIKISKTKTTQSESKGKTKNTVKINNVYTKK